jgi:hypothetical protein
MERKLRYPLSSFVNVLRCGLYASLSGVHVLFKEKNIHFESLEMRKQNSCSQSVKYDVQSLADFRNLIISNKDVFSALLSSFTWRVASQDEALQRSTLLIN